MAAPADILGLFPSFDSTGGVQASGREAWQSIVNHVGEQHARLFSYAPSSSRTGTVLKALRTDGRADVLLVWHLHLLKLLPLLDCAAGRVMLFLHGIEAWKQHTALTQWALGRVHLFLSNSNHTWERFLVFNPHFRNAAHKIVHLGSGAQLRVATPQSRQSPAVIMVGRMTRSEDYKGHRQMIEAWPLVLEHLPEAQLWIVGEGDLRPDLEHLARVKGLEGRVRFWGLVSDAQKDQLLANCRCLALPSRGEGFGLVYLEAMRMGRPCLVSTFDAGREIVNPPEAGLAIDPSNPQQIAEAVRRLSMASSEWEQWSGQARRRYETRFTALQFQERLLAAIFQA